MKLKLEQGFANYYHCLVKVKRDKPEWWPWEDWLGITVTICKHDGYWLVLGFFDDVCDKMLELFGETCRKHETKAGVLNDMRKLISSMPHHLNYKLQIDE